MKQNVLRDKTLNDTDWLMDIRNITSKYLNQQISINNKTLPKKQYKNSKLPIIYCTAKLIIFTFTGTVL